MRACTATCKAGAVAIWGCDRMAMHGLWAHGNRLMTARTPFESGHLHQYASVAQLARANCMQTQLYVGSTPTRSSNSTRKANGGLSRSGVRLALRYQC